MYKLSTQQQGSTSIEHHLLEQHPAGQKQMMWLFGRLETQHTSAWAERAFFAATPRQTPQSKAGQLACLSVHGCLCGYQA